MNDTNRKHQSYLATQAFHDAGNAPNIIKGDIGFSYMGAFAIWSVLKAGKWQACPRKPKTTETRTTMENF